VNPRRFSANGQANTSAGRLHKAKQALSPVLDQINQGLVEAEKRLRALQPVRDAWVPYSSEPDDPTQPDNCYHINYCIGIAKHSGEWRLCCGTTHDGYPEMDVRGVEPISETSRSVRVKVAAELASWLPKLREQVVEATESFLSEAKDALDKMLSGLGQI
jgi:hypothetical protein